MTPLFYPAHDPRAESSEYRRVHARLVVEENRPCAICGVTNAAVARARGPNPWRASEIETHHAIVEWALMNAIDLDQFNALVVRAHRGTRRIYARAFTREQMRAWIDHHEDNLLVLCDVHHRHRAVGIHSVAAPVWNAQPLLDPKTRRQLIQTTRRCP